jgi:ribose-phosphate pyrophosphokinase
MDYEFFTYDPVSGTLVPAPLEVFSYPMGDVTVRPMDRDATFDGAHIMWVHTPAPDWTLISEWATLVRFRNPDPAILVMPYLPSGRGDKDRPSPARANAVMAARSGITDIVTLDPHSPVWLDTMSAVDSSIHVHELALGDTVSMAVRGHTYLGVIGPDAGSKNRASLIADALELPVHLCSKHRDPNTGRLSGYQAPQEIIDNPGEYLVVDDICDGGGTFLLLAQALSDQHTLDLWVSHGGFTRGAITLLGKYRYSRKPDGVISYRNVFTSDSLRSAHITESLQGADPNSDGIRYPALYAPVDRVPDIESRFFITELRSHVSALVQNIHTELRETSNA